MQYQRFMNEKFWSWCVCSDIVLWTTRRFIAPQGHTYKEMWAERSDSTTQAAVNAARHELMNENIKSAQRCCHTLDEMWDAYVDFFCIEY